MKVEGLTLEKMNGHLRRKKVNEYIILDLVDIILYNGHSYENHSDSMNEMGPKTSILVLYFLLSKEIKSDLFYWCHQSGEIVIVGN